MSDSFDEDQFPSGGKELFGNKKEFFTAETRIITARGTEDGLILRIDGRALWEEILADVQLFLEEAGSDPEKVTQIRQYVENVPKNEIEFADKSSADKKAKDKKINKPKHPCTSGHWITKDNHHIFICD